MATLLHESQIARVRPRVADFPSGEARALESELKKRIEGEVRFEPGSRALYATDGSNYRQAPIGVVVPRTIEDILVAVEQSRHFGAPGLASAGGTSLAGHCCKVAVVLGFSKNLNKLIDLDPQSRTARVQPGAAVFGALAFALKRWTS
jgi:FAD/FMN-containing dehydrogenase